MTWYLNFCSPVTNQLQFNRKILTANLLLLLLLHIFVKFIFQCRKYNLLQNNFKQPSDDKSDQFNQTFQAKSSSIIQVKPIQKTIFGRIWINVKQIASKIIICGQLPLTQQQNNQYFSIIYGHHCICATMSIMYNPFISQIICTYSYTLLLIISCFFFDGNYKKLALTMWLGMAVINLYMLQSGLIGLAKSDFNLQTQNCI